MSENRTLYAIISFSFVFFCLKQIWFYTYCSRQYWWMRRVCKKVKKNPEKERYWFNLSDVYTSGLTAKWHTFLSLSKFLFRDCNFTVIACQSHICAISKLNFDSQIQTTTEAPLRIRNGQNVSSTNKVISWSCRCYNKE